MMDDLITTGLTEKSKHIREKYKNNPNFSWETADFKNMHTKDMKGYFTVGEIEMIEWYGRKWFMELSL